MNRPLSAVVFDYGCVISAPQDPELQKSMCDAVGLQRSEFEELYYRHRNEYDRGGLSASD